MQPMHLAAMPSFASCLRNPCVHEIPGIRGIQMTCALAVLVVGPQGNKVFEPGLIQESEHLVFCCAVAWRRS